MVKVTDEDLVYLQQPDMEDPVIIAGFSGWANSGEVADGVLEYLIESFLVKPLASLTMEKYVDYMENRPVVDISEGRLLDLEFPDAKFFYAGTKKGEPDLILFTSPEPKFKWVEYCESVFSLALKMGVKQIFTIGGTYDYAPHWLEPSVSAVYSDNCPQSLIDTVNELAGKAEYQGPISIHTMLMKQSAEYDLSVVGLWGHAPVYIQTGNLKLHYRIVEILKKALNLSFGINDLYMASMEMDKRIDEMIENDPKLKNYLKELNDEFPQPPKPTESQSKVEKPSEDSERGKVILIDDFLKRNED